MGRSTADLVAAEDALEVLLGFRRGLRAAQASDDLARQARLEVARVDLTRLKARSISASSSA